MKHLRKKARIYGLIRSATVGIAFLLQVFTMLILALSLYRGFFIIYLFLELVSTITIFALVNDQEAYRLNWVVVIATLPVFGFFLYFMWGRKRNNSMEYKYFRKEDEAMFARLASKRDDLYKLEGLHPNKVQIPRYLQYKGYTLYSDTSVKYYETGEKIFADMLKDLQNAKSFILLEYFIVADGKVWKDILEILTNKVKEGVEVKLLFDDFGTLLLNNRDFRRDMEARGIELCIYNPIHKRVAALSFNYRNHQKITVIDGCIGYTGGVNLADEYANIVKRFGYWKDTGIRLEGDAVWTLTNIFVEMWNVSNKKNRIDAMKYKREADIKAEGFVQPFAGGPHLAPDNPTEGAYTRMINKAREYVYITTPYLVLDQNMLSDLMNAAYSGVDVRIIVPAVYDKWVVYMVNVSNYGKLIKAGVKIFEYTPGFIHAKNVISDDECAICGTINMDYRSFYHHYECGCFLSEMDAIQDMKRDFLQTQRESHEISYEEWKNRPARQKFIQNIIKVISPLL